MKTIMKSFICFCSILIFTPLIISAQQDGENVEIKVVDRKDGSAIPHAVIQIIVKKE